MSHMCDSDGMNAQSLAKDVERIQSKIQILLHSLQSSPFINVLWKLFPG